MSKRMSQAVLPGPGSPQRGSPDMGKMYPVPSWPPTHPTWNSLRAVWEQ